VPCWVAAALCTLLLLAVANAAPANAPDATVSSAAASLAAGGDHTCAALVDGGVRCWGLGRNGELGNGTTDTVGDEESPGSTGPVNLGAGRAAKAISSGDHHSCALLDDGTVRCWGFGGDGRLGYGDQRNVNVPAAAGPVDLGAGRTAKAISAGGAHTCAILDNGGVRCWGYGGNGRLGYANTHAIGDNETPGSMGPVNLGAGRTAITISAGNAHTCALLDDRSVRCWGYGREGRLGNRSPNNNVGDDETPASVAPVELGTGRTAESVSAGGAHTCAVLDDGNVRCWGFGGNGRLGYADTLTIGDDETPGTIGPVDLGSGRTAMTISAGDAHTCALLDDRRVRCWGYGTEGRLGYGNTADVGAEETPGSIGPVELGSGRTAVAISAGARHTCVRLDDGNVRCWGYGGDGRLGYCNQTNIGDDETPGSVGPVALEAGSDSAGCKSSTSDERASTPGATSSQAPGPTQAPAPGSVPLVATDVVRARDLRRCRAAVANHARRERKLLRSGPARRRAQAERHLNRHANGETERCLRLYGRTPGRVMQLRARALSRTKIQLRFNAPGTHASRAPAARTYLIKQSFRPIRGSRDFTRAHALCRGSCRFAITEVGGLISLTVSDLRPRTTYYYAIVARDNVSARGGPRSRAVRARTR